MGVGVSNGLQIAGIITALVFAVISNEIRVYVVRSNRKPTTVPPPLSEVMARTDIREFGQGLHEDSMIPSSESLAAKAERHPNTAEHPDSRTSN